MIRVSINFVDGSHDEWDEPDAIVARLAELRREGHQGRALVDELLTDDWAAPPARVQIAGTLETGEVVHENLSCE